MPKVWGAPVLCDFGAAVPGDKEHTEDVQPNIYRAPEAILGVPWTHAIDIWNAGCMVRSVAGPPHKLYTNSSQRFGTFSRAGIYLLATIQNTGPTGAGRTLPRWWHCLGHRHKIFLPRETLVTNSFRTTVSSKRDCSTHSIVAYSTTLQERFLGESLYRTIFP